MKSSLNSCLQENNVVFQLNEQNNYYFANILRSYKNEMLFLANFGYHGSVIEKNHLLTKFLLLFKEKFETNTKFIF